ncbi:hypothetical protein JCM10207_001594 [Rhodosporidiobolus poonsookiae]
MSFSLLPPSLSALLASLSSRLPLPALPTALARPLQWLFVLLLVANANALPGVWHVRILWPFIKFQYQVKLGLASRLWPNDRVGKDEFSYVCKAAVKKFRASPEACDAFGFHLSNSEYATTLDHIRGPYAIQLTGECWMIEGMTFALGAANYEFKKEIPFMAPYEIHNSLLGYDRKWLYLQTLFVSPPHPRTGARTTYARSLHQLVLKHRRRTVPPFRAFALTGYDSDHGRGRENWAVVRGMGKREQLEWLVGDRVVEGLTTGSVERGLEGMKDWPGQVVKA